MMFSCDRLEIEKTVVNHCIKRPAPLNWLPQNAGLETLQSLRPSGLTQSILRVALMAMMVLALSACAANRGNQLHPPIVSLESLEHRDGLIRIDLGVRNPNRSRFDRPIEHISLSIDGLTPLLDQEIHDFLNIPPGGRETLSLRTEADEATLVVLSALATGERSSLPYSLTLTFPGRRDRDNPAEQNGFLHPVPGQPNRFR